MTVSKAGRYVNELVSRFILHFKVVRTVQTKLLNLYKIFVFILYVCRINSDTNAFY